MEANARVKGTVQWFSRVKGYGFIRPDGAEEDVFVHYSVIRGEGYRNLNKGQRVELTVEDSPKGPQAVDVVGLDEPDVEVVEDEADTGDVGFEEDSTEEVTMEAEEEVTMEATEEVTMETAEETMEEEEEVVEEEEEEEEEGITIPIEF